MDPMTVKEFRKLPRGEAESWPANEAIEESLRQREELIAEIEQLNKLYKRVCWRNPKQELNNDAENG